MADVIVYLLLIVGGFAAGFAVRYVWLEARHDCMPHDPSDCKGVANVDE